MMYKSQGERWEWTTGPLERKKRIDIQIVRGQRIRKGEKDNYKEKADICTSIYCMPGIYMNVIVFHPHNTV